MCTWDGQNAPCTVGDFHKDQSQPAESQETEGKGEERTEEPTGLEKPATESDDQPS